MYSYNLLLQSDRKSFKLKSMILSCLHMIYDYISQLIHQSLSRYPVKIRKGSACHTIFACLN